MRYRICLTCGGDYEHHDGDRSSGLCPDCLAKHMAAMPNGSSPVPPPPMTDGMAVMQLLAAGGELRWRPNGTTYRLVRRLSKADEWLIERTPTGTDVWQPVCSGGKLPAVLAEYRALEEEACSRN